MKYGYLIQYNMRNTFLEISYPKFGGETNTYLFHKNQNWAYLWINSSNFYVTFFNFMSSWRLAVHLLLPHIKFFWKTKRDLELVSLPHFLRDFWRKIFLLPCSITWRIFIVWLLLLSEILNNMCIVIIC